MKCVSSKNVSDDDELYNKTKLYLKYLMHIVTAMVQFTDHGVTENCKKLH